MITATDISRSQPFSDEAEKSVISCFLYDPVLLDQAVERGLDVQFYHPGNKLIFEQLVVMWNARKPIELPSVGQHFLDTGNMDKIGGPAMLAELYNFLPTAAHWPYYAGIMKDKALLRAIITVCTESIQKAYEYNEDVMAFLDGVEQSVLSIRPKDSDCQTDAMGAHVLAALNKIEEQITRGSAMSGHTTGFEWLDFMTKGLRPEIWYFGARPSEGKTSVLLQIINTYIDSGEPVGMFSLEMSRIALNQRLISLRSGVALSRMLGGMLNREEMKAVLCATKDIQKCKFYCDDRPALTHPQIRAKARRWKREHGVQMIGIDFLQRMGAPESAKRNRNRTEEHTENCRSLADCVKELDIPLVALAQLNREVEKGDRTPKLSDFEGCGSIEQDADLAMFIYRIKGTGKDDGMRKVWWDILKQRSGPCNRRLHLLREQMSAFDSTPIEEPVEEEKQPEESKRKQYKS